MENLDLREYIYVIFFCNKARAVRNIARAIAERSTLWLPAACSPESESDIDVETWLNLIASQPDVRRHVGDVRLGNSVVKNADMVCMWDGQSAGVCHIVFQFIDIPSAERLTTVQELKRFCDEERRVVDGLTGFALMTEQLAWTEPEVRGIFFFTDRRRGDLTIVDGMIRWE